LKYRNTEIHPNLSSILTFSFRKVMRQLIWGAVVRFIIGLSIFLQFIQERDSERIIKIGPTHICESYEAW